MGCVTTSLRRELSRKISTVSKDLSTVRTEIRMIRNDTIHTEWNTAAGFYQVRDALDHHSNGRLHKFFKNTIADILHFPIRTLKWSMHVNVQ